MWLLLALVLLPIITIISAATKKQGGIIMEYNAKVYTQNESKINGRSRTHGLWL